jgi:type VI secretion system protein ImpA
MEELPEGFDLAALLAPIAQEAPAGTDLREDYSPNSLYFRLRDARAEARDAERAADAPGSETDPAPAGGASSVPLATRWRTVGELATEALTVHCKDLEIAAWLIEALVRSDGLIGLAAGSRLMAGLAENFWDELFPHPDEEGLATKVAPIAGLNGVGREGSLVQPLRKLVLFERPTDGSPFYLYQYEQSFEVAKIADAAVRQQRFDRGVLRFDVVESEARAAETQAREAGSPLFALLRDQAAEAAEAWQALGQVLDRQAGADAPPTSQIRDLLVQIQDVAKRFAAPEAEASEEAATSVPGEAAGIVGAGPAPAAGGLTSREDALRALAQIAEFFRRTEPLSPIAYTLQEAVRRSRMTWPELLEEIVPDAMSRSAILTSLGIRPPTSE